MAVDDRTFPGLLNGEILPVGLMPFDLRGTPLEGLAARSTAPAAQALVEFARVLLPRILSLDSSALDDALEDLATSVERSLYLDQALEDCEDGWQGVVAATAVEVWAHGSNLGATCVAWDASALRHVARMLRSTDRPPEILDATLRIVDVSNYLERLARATDRHEKSKPGRRAAAFETRVFERLAGALPEKRTRAKIAAGLLSELARAEVTSKALLDADRKRGQRARGRARDRSPGL